MLVSENNFRTPLRDQCKLTGAESLGRSRLALARAARRMRSVAEVECAAGQRCARQPCVRPASATAVVVAAPCSAGTPVNVGVVGGVGGGGAALCK